jgi:hypothetical protein
MSRSVRTGKGAFFQSGLSREEQEEALEAAEAEVTRLREQLERLKGPEA